MSSVSETHESIDWIMDDILEGMICDVRVQSFFKAVYENMSIDGDTMLYPGSTNFT